MDQNTLIYCCCGVGVVLIIILIIFLMMSQKREKYIFGFSDKEKCLKNSKQLLTQHCNNLWNQQQLPMLKPLFRSRTEEDQTRTNFLAGCDHTKTLEELCSSETSRNLLKKLVDSSQELKYSAAEYASTAQKLKEKLKRENEASVVDRVFQKIGF